VFARANLIMKPRNTTTVKCVGAKPMNSVRLAIQLALEVRNTVTGLVNLNSKLMQKKKILKNISLLCLLALIYACVKGDKNRIKIEGYIYNGSISEPLKGVDVYLWEVSLAKVIANNCKNARESRICRRTTTDSKGYYCFRSVVVYNSECCRNMISTYDTEPFYRYGNYGLVDARKKEQMVNAYVLYDGGIIFNLQSIDLKKDSFIISISHKGHNANVNWHNIKNEMIKLEIDTQNGINTISGDGITVSNQTIKCNLYGMGTYEYHYQWKRRADGVSKASSGSIYANENEFVNIQI
jgi:hypothetical protein